MKFSVKNRAFTLAEVLISLIVIGIVSALTIPTIVQEYKKKEYSSRLKRFYSMMQQAIQLSEIDNGPLQSWDFHSSIADEEGNRDYEANFRYENQWISKYILPYLKHNKVTEGKYTEATEDREATMDPVSVYLNDGSIMQMFLGNCMDIVYDVNGEKLPNESAHDMYRFTICFTNRSAANNDSVGFRPYLSGRVTSRTNAYQLCKDTSTAYCSVLLWYDNWEYKEDYPYKL